MQNSRKVVRVGMISQEEGCFVNGKSYAAIY